MPRPQASSMLKDRYYDRPGPGRVEVPTSDWIVSTDDEDREGDTITGQLANWDIEGWTANGCPVLLNHADSNSLPIGNCLDPFDGFPCLWSDGKKTYCRVFHDLTTSIGRDAWSLVAKGLLNGASVGFLPLDKVHRRTGRRAFGGGSGGPWDVKTLEIAEISLTATPSNWRCVKLRNSKAASQWLTRKSVTAQGKLSESHGIQMWSYYAIERLEKKFAAIQEAVKAAKVGPTDRVSVLSNFPYIPGG